MAELISFKSPISHSWLCMMMMILLWGAMRVMVMNVGCWSRGDVRCALHADAYANPAVRNGEGRQQGSFSKMPEEQDTRIIFVKYGAVRKGRTLKASTRDVGVRR